MTSEQLKNQSASAPDSHASTRSVATAQKTVSPEVEAMLRGEHVAGLAMQARSALRRGNRDEARKLLQQVFALSPTDAGALELLGDIFLEEGEQEKAIAVFERGRKHDPSHTAFEEKIALAKIDQQEEELAKIRRETALQLGDTEKWQDKKPNLAALLSLVLPGAGHVYLEKYERAATYFGAWLVTVLGWYLPLHAALPTEAASAALRQSRSFLAPFAAALGNLGGFSKLLFWTMLLLNVGVYLASTIDATRSAKRDAETRKRELGL